MWQCMKAALFKSNQLNQVLFHNNNKNTLYMYMSNQNKKVLLRVVTWHIMCCLPVTRDQGGSVHCVTRWVSALCDKMGHCTV